MSDFQKYQEHLENFYRFVAASSPLPASEQVRQSLLDLVVWVEGFSSSLAEERVDQLVKALSNRAPDAGPMGVVVPEMIATAVLESSARPSSFVFKHRDDAVVYVYTALLVLHSCSIEDTLGNDRHFFRMLDYATSLAAAHGMLHD